MVIKTLKRPMEVVTVDQWSRVTWFAVFGMVGFIVGWICDHWTVTHNFLTFCGY